MYNLFQNKITKAKDKRKINVSSVRFGPGTSTFEIPNLVELSNHHDHNFRKLKDRVTSQWIVLQKKATFVLNDAYHYVNTQVYVIYYVLHGCENIFSDEN